MCKDTRTYKLYLMNYEGSTNSITNTVTDSQNQRIVGTVINEKLSND